MRGDDNEDCSKVYERYDGNTEFGSASISFLITQFVSRQIRYVNDRAWTNLTEKTPFSVAILSSDTSSSVQECA